jgi:hypothetical protein
MSCRAGSRHSGPVGGYGRGDVGAILPSYLQRDLRPGF